MFDDIICLKKDKPQDPQPVTSHHAKVRLPVGMMILSGVRWWDGAKLMAGREIGESILDPLSWIVDQHCFSVIKTLLKFFWYPTWFISLNQIMVYCFIIDPNQS